MKSPLLALRVGLAALALAPAAWAQTQDVPQGHWAKEAVDELVSKGVLTGFPDGTFRGDDLATRYQLALALYRLLQAIRQEIASMGFSTTLAGMSPKDLELLAESLAKLAGQVAEIELRVAALEKLGEAAGPSGEGLVGSLKALEGREGSIGGAAEIAEARLEEVLASLREVTARLAELESEVTSQVQDLDRAREDAESARELASKVFLDLVGLRKSYEELAKAVEGLKANLQDLAARPVQDLEARSRVAALEAALAAQKERLALVERGLEEVRSSAPEVKVAGQGEVFLGPAERKGEALVGLSARYGETSLSLLLGTGATLQGLGAAGEARVQTKTFGVRVGFSQDRAPALSPYLLSGDGRGAAYYPGGALAVSLEGVTLSLFAGEVVPGADPRPGLLGPYRGFLLSAESFALGAAELGGRPAFAVRAKGTSGPFSLEGSLTGAGLLAGRLSPLALAYAGSVGFEDPSLSLSVTYYAVDPAYGDGQAGGSSLGDEDLGEPGYPYPADSRGLEAEARLSYLGLEGKAYAEAEGDYAGSEGSFSHAFGLSVSLPVGSGKLGVAYNEVRSDGGGLLAPGERADLKEGYDPRSLTQERSASLALFYETSSPSSLGLAAGYLPASRALFGLAKLKTATGPVAGSLALGALWSPGSSLGYLVDVEAEVSGSPFEGFKTGAFGVYKALKDWRGLEGSGYGGGLSLGVSLGPGEVYLGFAVCRVGEVPAVVRDSLKACDPEGLGVRTGSFSTLSFGLKAEGLEGVVLLVGERGRTSPAFQLRYTLP